MLRHHSTSQAYLRFKEDVVDDESQSYDDDNRHEDAANDATDNIWNKSTILCITVAPHIPQLLLDYRQSVRSRM